jgi:integrase
MKLKEVLSAYRADREPIVVSLQRVDSTIKPLRRILGREDAANLPRSAIATYIHRRVAEGVLPQTVRRELITLRAALRLAWKERKIPHVLPLPMPPPGPGRKVALSSDQVAILKNAVAGDSILSLWLAIALATGARLTAILELTWARVDFDNCEIDFRDPTHPKAARRKNRAVVPMSPRLCGLLRQAHEERTSDRVINSSATTIQRRIQRAACAAGLKDVTPHVMRHTAATQLLRKVRLVTASRMLGHRSVAITEQVYGHLTVTDLRPAAEALDAWV